MDHDIDAHHRRRIGHISLALLALLLFVLVTQATSSDTLISPPHADHSPTSRSGDHLHVRVRTELWQFTDWLATNNARGYIGEIGWPGNLSAEETERWNTLADSWYRDADAAKLWVTAFMASRAAGPASSTGIYVNSTGDPTKGAIDTANPQHAVLQRHPQTADFRRGVNLYGTTFGVNDDGALDETAAIYPSQRDFDYLSTQGVTTVRLSVRWERLQRMLGAALDPREMTQLVEAIDAAGKAKPYPIDVILVLGDGAQYAAAIGDGTRRQVQKLQLHSAALNPTHLQGLWGLLSDQFRDNSTVVAYDLMNEPNGLSAEIQHFSGTDLFDWDGGTSPLWYGDGAAISTVDASQIANGHSLRVSKAGLAPGTYSNVFIQSPQFNSPADTRAFQCRIMLDPRQSGSWQAAIGWRADSPTHTMTFGPAFTLQTGKWIAVGAQFAAEQASGNLVIQVEPTPGSGAETLTFLVDDCAQGEAHVSSPAQVWEQISQQTLSYLREVKLDTKTLIIPGYDYSSVASWRETHPRGWITDPLDNFFYEGHHYWDSRASSYYTQTYDEENRHAEERGFPAVGMEAPSGAIQINGGASRTSEQTVKVTFSAIDDVDPPATLLVQISEDPAFGGGNSLVAYRPIRSSGEYTLSAGGGKKTLYARFRDAGGNTSVVVQSSIRGVP